MRSTLFVMFGTGTLIEGVSLPSLAQSFLYNWALKPMNYIKRFINLFSSLRSNCRCNNKGITTINEAHLHTTIDTQLTDPGG